MQSRNAIYPTSKVPNRVHNRDIKGKVRKKFKAALAVTAARDPIAERAKATAKAAIASVLAKYKDKAAV